MIAMFRICLLVATGLVATPALAHVGIGTTSSFTAGIVHPIGGLDHISVMIAVGLWAALKGGRAMWIWPATFVVVMLAGGGLGMAQIPLPLVEPAILASVVVLGLMVALAVNAPAWTGVVIIGGFGLFHGYAHGSEASPSETGILYMAGFALATAALHAVGLAAAFPVINTRWRPLVRLAGMACIVAGIGMVFELV